MDNNLGQIALVKDINPNVVNNYYNSFPESSSPYSLTEFDDRLYFVADDGTTGRELFVSDGTEAGTQLVKDLVLGSSYYGYPFSSNPDNLIEFSDRLYFTANDGVSGDELWATDGTSGGTQLVADVNPGNYGSNYSYFPKSSYARDFKEFGDKLYFTANDGANGRELFVSDGTAAGTQLVADINPGGNGAFSNYGGYGDVPDLLVEFDDKLYFTADNGTNGSELYVSDGTAAGTQLVADINPGGEGSDPTYLTEFNDKLYFNASDGTSGNELYVTDGTEAGTQLVADINPIVDAVYGFASGSYASYFTELNDKLYFVADDGISGRELFVTDGTAVGTQLVADLFLGNNGYSYSYGSRPQNLTLFNNKLYFTANDGENGRELYVTDGTSEGTQLVEDVRPGNSGSYSYPYPFSSNPNNLTVFNDKLYFTAVGGEIGRELYVTDGTTEGTQLVADLRPGNSSGYYGGSGSYPYDLTIVGDELFFTADNGGTGTELFKLTVDEPSIPQPVEPQNPIFTSGGDGSDSLQGSDAAEEIDGLSGQDFIDGGAGDDTLIGGDGDDRLVSASGNNSLIGGNGNDTLTGGTDDDNLNGGNGSDRLNGGDGDDTLIGGEDNDFLDGGAGNNILQGDNGDDLFVISGGGSNTIADFNLGGDRLGIDGSLEFEDFTLTGNTVLLGTNTVATLIGVDATQLKASDFTLV